MKKKMKRTTIPTTLFLIILFAFSCLQTIAQRKAPPEFSAYAAGGISTYCFHPRTTDVTKSVGYKNDFGIQFHQQALKKPVSIGYSSDFGVGFTGFFSQQVGIHTGAGFGLLNVKSKLTLSYVTYNQDIVDATGNIHPTELHTKLTNYTEIHKTLYVSIPVMFQFQTKQKQYWNFTRTQKAGFYAQAGIKMHLMFNNRYEASIERLSNAGYLIDIGNWAATQLFEGYGEWNNIPNGDGKLDFGFLVLFACEAGVKWRIDKNIYVYTGAFFDCGLYDPNKDKRQDNIDYSDPRLITAAPLLKSSEKVNLMVVGVKLRLALTRRQSGY